MPPRTYKKKRPSSKKASRGKRSVRPRIVSSTVKSYVKKMIHKQIENKQTGFSETNVNLNYAGSITSPTYLNLIPNISQGLSEGNRIGDEITVVKATVRGFVNLLPYNSTTNAQIAPVKVKMWLCRRKNGTNNLGGVLVPPVSATWGNFFQVANVSSGFTGGMLDMLKYPNNEAFTIFATKTIELANNAPNLGLGNTAGIYPTSGKVSAPFSFSFAKHLGKLKFNDSVNVPTNKEIFLVFQTVYADGSIPLVGTFCEVHSVCEMEFEDA